MTPLADLTLLSSREAVAINISNVYTIRVKLDVSIGVTIRLAHLMLLKMPCLKCSIRFNLDYGLLEHCRWDFGDLSSCINHTVGAPLERNDVPQDRTATQIYLQDTVHHIYTIPGK